MTPHSTQGKERWWLENRQELGRNSKGPDQRSLDVKSRWLLDGHTTEAGSSSVHCRQPTAPSLQVATKIRDKLQSNSNHVWYIRRSRREEQVSSSPRSRGCSSPWTLLPKEAYMAQPELGSLSRAELQELSYQSRPPPSRALWITLTPTPTSLWGLRRFPEAYSRKQSPCLEVDGIRFDAWLCYTLSLGLLIWRCRQITPSPS